MKILFATDHAGFKLKESLVSFVQDLGFEVEDLGAHQYNKEDDYPDFVSLVARQVSENPDKIKGIILGGSGQGEAMVANRFSNVRAAVYYGMRENVIMLSREHNDANILSLGARFLGVEEAKDAVKIWLKTSFSGDERHTRRISKLEHFSK
ncbi:RpiB/LacA/LacB family sugar-phosphate isomerase [Patescibacteria group bacterium]|nr:RpiB/LacA/LacB family sugar-phosphate isomerase [Patescibacteria group bacterium]